GIHLLAFQVYKNAMQFLSIHGLVAPEPEDLGSPLGSLFISGIPCGFEQALYPRLPPAIVDHLTCPSSLVEHPLTVGSFYESSAPPAQFMTDEAFSSQVVRLYASCTSPKQTRALHLKRYSIGNARDYTAWMIQTALTSADVNDRNAVFADWNLDSDRGYGYKNWTGTVPDISGSPSPNPSPEGFSILDEAYVNAP
ncbi:MAG: hypothetical protein VYA34_02930, partial [Myxococcota bacterium]|nr:hypothetical protein [Myxococcota bacterium]